LVSMGAVSIIVQRDARGNVSGRRHEPAAAATNR
jgi:hypothetical protein